MLDRCGLANVIYLPYQTDAVGEDWNYGVFVGDVEQRGSVQAKRWVNRRCSQPGDGGDEKSGCMREEVRSGCSVWTERLVRPLIVALLLRWQFSVIFFQNHFESFTSVSCFILGNVINKKKNKKNKTN
jgi:hypothetical protein